MEAKAFTVQLNNGQKMPILGYGTFLSKPGEVTPGIRHAVLAGYRSFDCAYVYENEKEIGDAFAAIFKEGLVKREELFITSKLPAGHMDSDQAIEGAFKKTLGDLQLEYLDLYLVHLPISVDQTDGTKPRRAIGYGLQDIWRCMEKLNKSGQAKSIGVSNYNAQTLNDLLCYARIPPVVNQVERHPYLPQNELVKFCRANNVYVTGYASLGARGLEDRTKRPELVELVDSPVIAKIAKTHNKTPAQVLLRWSIDSEVICIPKSVNETRIKENIDVFDFKLSTEEMAAIGELGSTGLRLFTQEWTGAPCFF